MSVARSGGYLFGEFTLEDIPVDLFFAIDHALRIVNWQENLTEDEMPPKWMWHLDWELETHFEIIKSKREVKYGSSEFENDEEYADPSSNLDNAFASRFFD